MRDYVDIVVLYILPLTTHTLVYNTLWPHNLNYRSPPLPPLLVASYGGCFLVKKCAELAYSKHHRSMLAGDMVLEIPTVFQTILEVTDK